MRTVGGRTPDGERSGTQDARGAVADLFIRIDKDSVLNNDFMA